MVDPVKMKGFLDIADPRAPPVEITTPHFVPAIIWNAPILAPFFGEGIDLEDFLGRRAAAPSQIENGAVGPDIRAVTPDAKGNITHQINLLGSAVTLERLPLAEGHPLHVGKEKLLAHQFR